MRKQSVFQMRIGENTAAEMRNIQTIIERSLIGEQSRGRGTRVTMTDLTMLALDYAYTVPGAGLAARAVGMGFDRSADAVRRINTELAYARRRARAKQNERQALRDRLTLIPGGLDPGLAARCGSAA